LALLLALAPFVRADEPAVGIALNATSSVLWNPQHTYEYSEPCSGFLRNPPDTYANLSYGGGIIIGGELTTYYPEPQECLRLSGTDNASYAYVASNWSKQNIEFTKNGSVSLSSTNITERLSLRLNKTLPNIPFLLVTHKDIAMGLDGDQDDLAVFRYANYSFPGTCAKNKTYSTGTYVAYNLSCLAAADKKVLLNGTDLGDQGRRLILTDRSDPPDAIHFAPENLTTEWLYVIQPSRRVTLAIKAPSNTLGTTWTSAWTWNDACLVIGDCTCSGWATTIGTKYFVPNGTNQSMSCAPTCSDTDGSCTDGSWGGCTVAFQESFSGSGASTLDTGPLQGTNLQPAFCGGQSCSVTTASSQTVSRNLSVVRTNTTSSKFHLRCGGALPGAPSPSAWNNIYVYSPGIPNITGVMWFDAGDPQTNGTNQSERLEGNKTCFNATTQSDGTVYNVSLWTNASINNSNSTTFRLAGLNESTGSELTNTSVTYCVNVTNGLDGTNSWANYSWAFCVFNNWTTTRTTAFQASESRNGFSCAPTRSGIQWTSGTTMTTANSAGTFNWFNLTWPNAAVGADPCAPTGAWTVSTTITCTNVNITVDSVNITDAGSLTLRNVTLRTGNVHVTGPGAGGSGGRLSYENTTFDGSQAWWLNGNLTVAGNVNISGVKLYLNGSADGMAGINNTHTGYLRIRGNATNVTAGETTTFGYFWWNDYGSNLSVQDTAIYYSGYSGFRYGRGLTINTTSVNFTRVKIYDSSYVGITILEGANGTNYTATDISRAADATLQTRYAKELNFSQHNSTLSGGGPSLIMDGLVIEHANMSGNTGDGIGGNGVQNLTLIDVNMTSGSQSGIGLANVKNLTIISSNITGNAWHGISGYTMNGVYVHDANTSGNSQSGIGINYDQLTLKTTSKSNYILAYNTTIADTIAFAGSVNLTTWNTTMAAVTYGTCTICNLTVGWPLSIYLQDANTNASLNNARAQLYSRDRRENQTNVSGASGYIRYVNVTEYARYASTTYVWIGNHTLNASTGAYENATLSLNVSSPNATTVNLTPSCVPFNITNAGVTQADWTIDLLDDCYITDKDYSIGTGTMRFVNEGNATFTRANITTGDWGFEGSGLRRNITVQQSTRWRVGGTGT